MARDAGKIMCPTLKSPFSVAFTHVVLCEGGGRTCSAVPHTRSHMKSATCFHALPLRTASLNRLDTHELHAPDATMPSVTQLHNFTLLL